MYVDPWPVRYVSIRGMSLVMRRNDLWWSRDLAGAYFNGVLAGCLRPATEAIRWVLSPDQRAYVAMRSKQFGCWP